jgi:head-tail adaptor
MAVRSGRLRNRLELWKKVGTRDKFGAITNEKERIGIYWCNIDNVSNNTIGGDVRQNQDQMMFETRYNRTLEKVDQNMYIVFRGVEYSIDSVLNPRYLNEKLLIECTARGNE